MHHIPGNLSVPGEQLFWSWLLAPLDFGAKEVPGCVFVQQTQIPAEAVKDQCPLQKLMGASGSVPSLLPVGMPGDPAGPQEEQHRAQAPPLQEPPPASLG